MSNFLLEVQGNKLLNQSIFAHRLQIYDDRIVFKKRGFIKKEEVTIAYTQIAQANLRSGLMFSTIEIINSGGFENAIIKHVPNKDAKRAKNIIDRKIREVHSKPEHNLNKNSTISDILEKSLSRVDELYKKGRLTKKEHTKKRNEILSHN